MIGSSLFISRHCVVGLSLVSDGMTRSAYPTQYSQWENETTGPTVSYCWQTSFIIRSHLSPTWEHTCFAGTATVNRSPHWHSPAADWKRLSGRPRRTWLQQVEEDIGLSVGVAQIASQDRSMWRTLRPTAGQAQLWVSEWVISQNCCHCQLVNWFYLHTCS